MKNARQILVKNGVHIGTQRKVESMKRFVFKVREDGLAVLNVQETLERIKTVAKLINQYPIEDVMVVASKEQGQKPAEMFSKITGATRFLGRFMPGTMTNPELEYFIEPKLLVACDPYGDRQAISEAISSGIPVICLASTNNTIENVDIVIPCNNKGRRSLAAVYYVLTNQTMFERGDLKEDEDLEAPLEDFIGDMPKDQQD